jgi:ubiquinone/menaquinone biosynthesis C-methylase UbiE
MNGTCELASRRDSGGAPAGPVARLDREKVSRAYSSPPWWYDIRGFGILTFSYRTTLRSEVAFFARNVRGRHLEVAIGSGTLFKMILWYRKLRRQPAASVVGIDCSEAMLSGARRAFASWRNVEIRWGDATALEAGDGVFLSANVANALHAFARPEAALAEIRRVLAPGGTLAINVLLHPRGTGPLSRLAASINRWAIGKGILARTYRVEDVRRMVAAAGFEVREERIVGNCLSLVAVKPL